MSGRLRFPNLRFANLAAHAREAGRSPAAIAGGSPEEGPVVWPDLEALAADAVRTWDAGLAVLGALPRVGVSSAVPGWAVQRGDPARVVLVDAHLEQAGGLWLVSGKGVTARRCMRPTGYSTRSVPVGRPRDAYGSPPTTLPTR